MEHIGRTNPPRARGKLFKVTMGVIAAIMLPPFAMLAIAPMLLFMLPVFIVGLPFVLGGFVTVALPTPREQRYPQRALQPAH
jgi:fatty acid desaturase